MAGDCSAPLTSPALLSRPATLPSWERREKASKSIFFSPLPGRVGGGPGEGQG